MVVSELNFTYHGLHFLSVSRVSKVPFPKSQTHRAPAGTSAKKFTWHRSVLQTKFSSKPLWIIICDCLKSSIENEPPPPPVDSGNHWISITRVVITSPVFLFLVSIVIVCKPFGTTNSDGLQSLSSIPKSVVI